MPTEELITSIHARYQKIQKEIHIAARRVQRDAVNVKLLVVTKKQPLDVVRAAFAAGITTIGENYPEEALQKKEELGAEAQKAEWHMIGHIQSRKARMVVEGFSLVHSLDSLKLARRLDRFAGEAGRKQPVLLEFNVGEEESKFGWRASDEKRWADLLPDVEAILALENLDVQGLMTMPPFFDDAELARPYFRRLRALRDYFSVQYPDHSWNQLSMGTSGDFQVAVEEGATIVRIGQAILGARPL